MGRQRERWPARVATRQGRHASGRRLDAQGINHCHNVIELANGGEIEVIHNHSMMSYECLSPGQKLSLTPLNSDWVVAKDAQ